MKGNTLWFKNSSLITFKKLLLNNKVQSCTHKYIVSSCGCQDSRDKILSHSHMKKKIVICEDKRNLQLTSNNSKTAKNKQICSGLGWHNG